MLYFNSLSLGGFVLMFCALLFGVWFHFLVSFLVLHCFVVFLLFLFIADSFYIVQRCELFSLVSVAFLLFVCSFMFPVFLFFVTF